MSFLKEEGKEERGKGGEETSSSIVKEKVTFFNKKNEGGKERIVFVCVNRKSGIIIF